MEKLKHKIENKKRKYGKDDMNLVEFPFATLSARSNEKIMLIEREEKTAVVCP